MSLKYEAYARRLHLLAQIVLHGTAHFSRPRTPHSYGAGELHGIPNARVGKMPGNMCEKALAVAVHGQHQTNLKSRVRAENALKQLEASPLWATVHASMIEYVGMPVSCYGEAAWGHVRLTRM